MKFDLTFENSNDVIEFEVVANHDLISYFIQRSQQETHSFTDASVFARTADKLTTDIHNAVSRTNQIMWNLCQYSFPEHQNLVGYLDQTALNRQHAEWVRSQNIVIDIDQLRFSADPDQARLGYALHDAYPDAIRKVRLAEAMSKLGMLWPYEEVNMTVHRLEAFLSADCEFKSEQKWQVFDNPFVTDMTSNNDVVNFSFGYTYVGRQYYNKWQFFDTDLDFDDHYNYETLEWAFQVNLARPETVPYSPEFLHWCKTKQVAPISTQLPIANVVDIENKLFYYRKMLYENSRQGNRARLSLH